MKKSGLFMGTVLLLVLAPISAFGQLQSSGLSSSGLSTNPSSGSLRSAGHSTQSGQLDWLNQRLSETRSRRIRSRLGMDKQGLSSTKTRGASSYLKRRAALTHGDETRNSVDRLDTLKAGIGLPAAGDKVTTLPGPAPAEGPSLPSASAGNSPIPSNPVVGIAGTPNRVGVTDGAPQLESQTGLKSQPLYEESQQLFSNQPASSQLGNLPFETVDEKGEMVDQRLVPLVPKEEGEEEVDEEKEEEEPLIPGREKAPVEEILQERLIPSRVKPPVPAPPPTVYQLQSQKMWSQKIK